MGRGARDLARRVGRYPPPQRRKSGAGPPHKGEVWSKRRRSVTAMQLFLGQKPDSVIPAKAGIQSRWLGACSPGSRLSPG